MVKVNCTLVWMAYCSMGNSPLPSLDDLEHSISIENMQSSPNFETEVHFSQYKKGVFLSLLGNILLSKFYTRVPNLVYLI